MKKNIIFLWAVMAVLTAVSASADIPNISFGGDLKNMSQPQVTDQLRNYMAALSNQAASLKSEYTAVAAQARGKIGGSDQSVVSQLAFANAVANIGDNLSTVYRRGNNLPYDRTYEIDPAMAELLEKIGGMFDKSDASELYKAKLRIFQLAKYIEQRKVWLSTADKTAKENELKQLITDTNKTYRVSIPSSTIYNILHTIQFQLPLDIPRACGPNAKQLITIFEDDAQFRAWTDEAELLGFTLDLPWNRSAVSKENTIAAAYTGAGAGFCPL